MHTIKSEKMVMSVIKNVCKEYRSFQNRMFWKGRNAIWENCGKIHFYCSVMEYFQYCGKGCRRYWEVLAGNPKPIQAMWDCYLKYETLEYTTWQGIEDILKKMEENRSRERCA